MKTARAAIALLDRELEVISLDHDLGYLDYVEEPAFLRDETGYDVILEIERRCFEDPDYFPPRIEIHTANPVGRAKMEASREAIERQAQWKRAAQGESQ